MESAVLVFCTSRSCVLDGCEQSVVAVEDLVALVGSGGVSVRTGKGGCMGACGAGPNLLVKRKLRGDKKTDDQNENHLKFFTRTSSAQRLAEALRWATDGKCGADVSEDVLALVDAVAEAETLDARCREERHTTKNIALAKTEDDALVERWDGVLAALGALLAASAVSGDAPHAMAARLHGRRADARLRLLQRGVGTTAARALALFDAERALRGPHDPKPAELIRLADATLLVDQSNTAKARGLYEDAQALEAEGPRRSLKARERRRVSEWLEADHKAAPLGPSG